MIDIFSFRISLYLMYRFDTASYVISDGGHIPTSGQALIFRHGFCDIHKAARVSNAFVRNGFQTRLVRLLLNDINNQAARDGIRKEDGEEQKRAIGIGNLYGLFVFWGVGLVLSGFVFGWEHLKNRREKKAPEKSCAKIVETVLNTN